MPRRRRRCVRRAKQIEELARYEPKFQEALAALESARISVEDVGASLRDYAGGIMPRPNIWRKWKTASLPSTA